ncbi:hypothetical protein [Nocardia sp. NPDC058705]|uniref:hypothetical protein n=1 Tax=Nocardia sp. NPDC058705 TaxID=3346609 RepID=UPI00369E3468
MAQLQRELEADAAECMWIDQVSRGLERPGRDLTGAVHTILDENNLPLRITVSSDWQLRLSVGRLDAAIMEAAGVAFADGWQRATEEVRRAMERGEKPPTPALISTAEPADERSLDEVIEDVLAMVSKKDSSAPTASMDGGDLGVPQASGRNENISFEFSEYGITSCRIDESWARRRAASRVATDINSTLIEQKDLFAFRAQQGDSRSSIVAAAEQLVGRLQRGELT